MTTSLDPRLNQLLSSLPAEEWVRWLPELERVDMPLGEVLYESGVAITHVYFPITSIVSLLYVMEDGASAEIAVERRSDAMNFSAGARAMQPRDPSRTRWLPSPSGHGYGYTPVNTGAQVLIARLCARSHSKHQLPNADFDNRYNHSGRHARC